MFCGVINEIIIIVIVTIIIIAPHEKKIKEKCFIEITIHLVFDIRM
jgi:hypothetical protein